MIESIIDTTDVIEQLRGSIVTSYDTDSGGETVETIVTALLTFQKITPLITVGTIEPTDTIAFSVSNITILNAIYQLRETVGGYISVNIDRELNWLDDIGEDTGQQIRFRKNLKGVVKEVDWGGLCTRLYPSGSEVVLSDNDIIGEAADKSSEGSYGYLTLIPQYVCYKDWTALGAALPASLKVYRQSDWVSYSPDEASGWTDSANAHDGNTGTNAYYVIPNGQFLSATLLVREYTPTLCNAVRIYFLNLAADIAKVKVQISTDNITYTTIYYGVFEEPWGNYSWTQFPFAPASGPIEAAYVRVHLETESLIGDKYVYIGEVEFRSNYFVDTAVWKQGADERTLRCAIGDYESGDTYFVSYTHANYLRAWDKIGTYGDIAKTENNSKIAYADALLVWGRLMLTSYKIPPVSYEVEALMLSECGANFDFEKLELGSIVNVVDEELGIDIDARVVRINYPDLIDPSKAVVEISSKVSDLADTFKDIYNKLE